MSAPNTQTLAERIARRRIELFHRRLNPALSQAIRKQKEARDALNRATAHGTALDIQSAQLRLGQAAATVLHYQEANADSNVGVDIITPAFLKSLDSLDIGDDACGQPVHNRTDQRTISFATHMLLFALLLALDPHMITVVAAAIRDATVRANTYTAIALAAHRARIGGAQLFIIKALVSYLVALFFSALFGSLF